MIPYYCNINEILRCFACGFVLAAHLKSKQGVREMKKWTALLLALVMCLALCACGGSEAKYEDAFENAYAEIAALNEATNAIADYNLNAWDKVGADDIVYFLDMSARAQNNNDVGTGLAWKTDYPLMDKVFDTNIEHANGMTAQQNAINEEVIPHFLAYQESLQTAEEKDAAISALIKDMKEQYGKKHAEAIDALAQYYLDSSSYYAYVLDLTGKNLLTYRSEIDTFKTTVTASMKAAELAK